MTEVNITPPGCLWCHLHRDTRKILAFLLAVFTIIVAAKTWDNSGSKVTTGRKSQFIPMGPPPAKNKKDTDGTAPLVPLAIEIEKESPL